MFPHCWLAADSEKKGVKGGAATGARLHAGMISAPQGDLRHTGHVGYDGAVFGDVAFVGKDYEQLPVKGHSPSKRTRHQKWRIYLGIAHLYWCALSGVFNYIFSLSAHFTSHFPCSHRSDVCYIIWALQVSLSFAMPIILCSIIFCGVQKNNSFRSQGL